jgi:hypothetical protein
MRKLDLHGVRHREVDLLVENYIFEHQRDFPVEIICGNSSRMMSLVMRVLKRLDCEIDKSLYGIIIVRKFK